jgi:hypothetical protein
MTQIYETLRKDFAANENKVRKGNDFTIFSLFPNYTRIPFYDISIDELLAEIPAGHDDKFYDDIHYVTMNTIAHVLLQRALAATNKDKIKIFNKVFGYYAENTKDMASSHVKWLLPSGERNYSNYKNSMFQGRLRKAYSTYHKIGKNLSEQALDIFRDLFSNYEGYNLENLTAAEIEKGGGRAGQMGESKLLKKDEGKMTLREAAKLFEGKDQDSDAIYKIKHDEIEVVADPLDSMRDNEKFAGIVLEKLKENKDRGQVRLDEEKEELKAVEKVKAKFEKLDAMDKVLHDIGNVLGSLEFDIQKIDLSDKEKDKTGISAVEKALSDGQVAEFIAKGESKKIRQLSAGLFNKALAEQKNKEIKAIIEYLDKLEELANQIKINHAKLPKSKLWDFFYKTKKYLAAQNRGDSAADAGRNIDYHKNSIDYYEKTLEKNLNAQGKYQSVIDKKSALYEKAKARLNKTLPGHEVFGRKMGDEKQHPKMSEKWKQSKLAKQPALTEEQLHSEWMKHILKIR